MFALGFLMGCAVAFVLAITEVLRARRMAFEARTLARQLERKASASEAMVDYQWHLAQMSEALLKTMPNADPPRLRAVE